MAGATAGSTEVQGNIFWHVRLPMFSLQFISQASGPIREKKGESGHVDWNGQISGAVSTVIIRASTTGVHPARFHGYRARLVGITAFVFFFSALLWQRYAGAVSRRGIKRIAGAEAGRAGARRPRAFSRANHQRETNVYRIVAAIIGPMVSKEFSYLIRNGFAFFLLVLPPAQILLFQLAFVGKHAIFAGRGLNADLLFPAMMAYTVLVR